MFLNDKEEKIIGEFYGNIREYGKKEMLLVWKNKGMILAKYVSDFEDDNDLDYDDPDFEECWCFFFKALKIAGNPPVTITGGENLFLDYRNFPDIIMADGKKIN